MTTTICVGSLVAAVAFRSPPLLAKIASTLDHVSNGRLVLGLGAGWEREEYDAHNYPYPSNAERLESARGLIKLLKVMWTQDEPTYRGTHFSIEKAYNNPRPLEKPHPPIMLGGSGSKLLKIAAAEADIANLIPPIFNGKDLIDDPAAACEIRQGRVQAAHRNAAWSREGGRPQPHRHRGKRTKPRNHFKRQEPSGFRRAGDSQKKWGFPDEEAAPRGAPSILGGTPDEVKREIRSRIEEIGMTYFVVLPDSEEFSRTAGEGSHARVSSLTLERARGASTARNPIDRRTWLQNGRQAMTAAEYKERAIRFLENFNHPDPRVFEELITDDFTFAMITTMKEFAPVRGKAAFARIETERLNALFPGGLRMKLGTVICDGPHVAVQAECDTVAMNGRRYVQRYHFYLRFEGDLIAEGLEYNDTTGPRSLF